jgi:hypothetical protein
MIYLTQNSRQPGIDSNIVPPKHMCKVLSLHRPVLFMQPVSFRVLEFRKQYSCPNECKMYFNLMYMFGILHKDPHNNRYKILLAFVIDSLAV